MAYTRDGIAHYERDYVTCADKTITALPVMPVKKTKHVTEYSESSEFTESPEHAAHAAKLMQAARVSAFLDAAGVSGDSEGEHE